MCEECGCNGEKQKDKMIFLDKSVTELNDSIADKTRIFLKEKSILCINIMGAPGSGKTTVIEGIADLIPRKEIAVIQGDLESDVDKKRLEKMNIETFQINTHSGCHLNADMIESAISGMNLDGKKYLFIENVGNLVCPAGVKMGQHINIVISSTTEGSDKPKKYPLVFMDSRLIVISKYDLKDAVDFNEKGYVDDIVKINGRARIIKTSSKDSESFTEMAHFIEHERKHLLEREHEH
ncbi:hydrogenase nickel incorporation protein HypB [Candidatus Woesearchaeota archaeon]|nr:hydrogenase nickel incorporation protein HypB [Candidatus Woesearchaeota archaeon]